eukprot:g25544.t1
MDHLKERRLQASKVERRAGCDQDLARWPPAWACHWAEQHELLKEASKRLFRKLRQRTRTRWLFKTPTFSSARRGERWRKAWKIWRRRWLPPVGAVTAWLGDGSGVMLKRRRGQGCQQCVGRIKELV